MSNTTKLTFIFMAAVLVIGGMVLALGGMLSEPTTPSGITGAPNTTANATYAIIKTVGVSSTTYLLPVVLIIAALVVISAIYLFRKSGH